MKYQITVVADVWDSKHTLIAGENEVFVSNDRIVDIRSNVYYHVENQYGKFVLYEKQVTVKTQ